MYVCWAQSRSLGLKCAEAEEGGCGQPVELGFSVASSHQDIGEVRLDPRSPGCPSSCTCSGLQPWRGQGGVIPFTENSRVPSAVFPEPGPPNSDLVEAPRGSCAPPQPWRVYPRGEESPALVTQPALPPPGRPRSKGKARAELRPARRETHGQRRLAGYSSQGRKVSDRIEVT